jgi:hypothetical protein
LLYFIFQVGSRPWLPSTLDGDSSTCASQVAGITGVCHHASPHHLFLCSSVATWLSPASCISPLAAFCYKEFWSPQRPYDPPNLKSLLPDSVYRKFAQKSHYVFFDTSVCHEHLPHKNIYTHNFKIVNV